MKPTENKQEAPEELIVHIRKNLKAHEESYKTGAWEKFNALQQNKRTPIFWITRLGGVAAIIAICFTLFLLSQNNSKKLQNQLVKADINKNFQVKDNSITQEGNSNDLDKSENFKDNNEKSTIKSLKPTIDKNIIFVVKSDYVDKTNEVFIDNNHQSTQSQNLGNVDQNSSQQIVAMADEKLHPATEKVLNKEINQIENVPERVVKTKNKSKWVLGLMIAPSLGNTEELNMGYGLSMGYSLSDKLALVTGVSYNEMSATKDFTNNIAMSSVLYGNNKSLSAISQKVTGLDIPLELKYSFNSNVYASVGVSAFAVIGQSRNNTFIQGVVVSANGNKITSQDGATSNADLSGSKGQFANTYILNKKVVEKVDLEAQNNVNYLGFYNFSIGYKKRMLKRHFVAFEPFIKLPIREVTQDNLKLVGAGLRVKVDF